MTTNPNETFLSRSQQAKRWSVSKRSVERWGEDEKLGLPPEIDINGRRYRKLSEIEAWERARVVASITKSAERRCAAEAKESGRDSMVTVQDTIMLPPPDTS
jgi:hypothetical protein